jgi:hypothetical protein
MRGLRRVEMEGAHRRQYVNTNNCGCWVPACAGVTRKEDLKTRATSANTRILRNPNACIRRNSKKLSSPRPGSRVARPEHNLVEPDLLRSAASARNSPKTRRSRWRSGTRPTLPARRGQCSSCHGLLVGFARAPPAEQADFGRNRIRHRRLSSMNATNQIHRSLVPK